MAGSSTPWRGSSRPCSRGAALAALLGTTPGLAVAKPKGKGKGKRKRKTTEAGRGRDRGGDRRQGARKSRGQAKRRKDRDQLRQRRAEPARTARAEEVSCCGTRACPPGPGSQSAACDFTDADLAGLDLMDAHLGKITGTRADFSGALARGASFGTACLRAATFIGPQSIRWSIRHRHLGRGKDRLGGRTGQQPRLDLEPGVPGAIAGRPAGS